MHRSTLIISDNPEFETIAKILEPYQEEPKEEYLQFISQHEKKYEEWKNNSVEKVLSPKGMMYNKWDERFRTEIDEIKIPENYHIKEFKLLDLYDNFDDYMKEVYPYIPKCSKNNKYGYWANPNTKWDYWNLGGRWSGLLTGEDITENPENYEICYLCKGTGYRNDHIAQSFRKEELFSCNGCSGFGKRLKHPSSCIPVQNQIQIKDFDADKLYQKQIQKYSEIWDKTIHLDPKTRLEKYKIEDYFTKDMYLNMITKPLYKIHSLIYQNKWYEKGHTNWWKKDENDYITEREWSEELMKLLKETDPQKWLTIIDCHI